MGDGTLRVTEEQLKYLMYILEINDEAAAIQKFAITCMEEGVDPRFAIKRLDLSKKPKK